MEDEMVIDKDFVDSFQRQIDLLENMQDAVKQAIQEAKKNLDLLKANHGKNIKDVIRPDQDHGGRGKDHK
jgi:regulator of extracellular matrix RemA (YlzA/DUF370 family)